MLQKLDDLRRRKLDEVASPILALLFAVFVVAALIHRLRLGVDFTDESFSTALAYRFAQGDHPFVDEVNSAQTAGILLWPFVWLYLKINGSSSGIMLFSRLVFLVFKLGVASAVFATIRRHVAWPLALVASFLALVFVPHSIPNVGYNVLGSGFQALGAWIAVRGYGETPAKRALFWGGVCNGLAIIAYPPLLVPAVALGAVLFFTPRITLRQVGEFVLGGVIVGACFAPLLVAAGSKNIQLMLDLGARLTPRPMSKMFDLAIAFWTHSPISIWVVPALAIVIGALRIKPAWGAWVLPLLVSGLAFSQPISITASLALSIYAGLFAPVFLVLLWDLPFCRALFFIVWIPSFLAGFITAFTSTNGELNGGLGFFPAAILFVVYEAIAVERLWRDGKPERAKLSPLLLLGPAVLVLSFLAHFCFSVYRDDPLPSLTSRVTGGPYRGLYTSAAHLRQSTELEDIFRRFDNPQGKVLVLWELPGAYLFTTMRSAGDSVWPAPILDQDVFLTYYRAHVNGQGIALKVGGAGKMDLPIERFLETNGRPLESTAKFAVFAEPLP